MSDFRPAIRRALDVQPSVRWLGEMIRRAAPYRSLRARLLQHGLNLKKFAEQRGYPISTVYCAATGTRGGAASVKVRAELEALAGQLESADRRCKECAFRFGLDSAEARGQARFQFSQGGGK